MATIAVRQTEEFGNWLHRLKDERARARIVARIRRVELGNPGDTKHLGDGLREMRIDYGPGYRIYFVERDASVVLLLCGGDKQTQQRDIARARKLAKELKG
jgi:putative addiction module killer protein